MVKDHIKSFFTIDDLDLHEGEDTKSKVEGLLTDLERKYPRWRHLTQKDRKKTNPMYEWIYLEVLNHFK